jgi:dihydrodipicolinate synthase/N-acetylneuraminate lyase
MAVSPGEAKSWAKEKLNGIITALIPTFTNDFQDLNEKAITHDIDKIASQGFCGFSIVTEAGTTPDENKRFMEISVKQAKGKLLTVLLSTFSTLKENLEMATFAHDVGVDMIQLGYPAMWYPNSIDDVLQYTRKFSNVSKLPIILWAAEMWGWCGLLPDPSNYPKKLLLSFASIDDVVAIKAGTKNQEILREIFSTGIIPGTVSEPLWPLWISKFGAQWGGISEYNHLYYCTEYFKLLKAGHWDKGMDLYFKMAPIRDLWGKMLRSEVGGTELDWAWTGHNRLRWKYAAWLAGLNGGPLRGNFRIGSADMIRIRKAMMASGIPVTMDEDRRFFEGRNPA